MKEIILIKNGEIALKGLNRGNFEDMLIKNCKRRLRKVGSFKFSKAQSTIYVTPAQEDIDLDEAMDCLSTVYGIAALCRSAVCEKDMQVICTTAAEYLADQLAAVKTFKVETKRSDKRFPLPSPKISAEVGGYLLSKFHNLKVDVHNPDLVVTVEVRDFGAYVHAGQTPGAGGIPVGSGGRAALLISGGIDSPVAGCMMAKRGLEVIGIHFASPPYTSDRALYKVEQLVQKMTRWCGRIYMYVVPFTKIQEEIRDKVPEDYFTLVMRRFMMRISEEIALRENCGALITGESLGQVASQTMQALGCTDIVTTLPVLRPVIGMDKEEIVAFSRKIDTFEISIQPYEDCCTVFTPAHPKTKPKVADLEEIEKALDMEGLIREAVEGAEGKVFHQN